MAGLCWMVVVLVFSLSVGNSVAVTEKDLAFIMSGLKNRYFIKNMQFSLAANIPADLKNIANAFAKDDPKVVGNTVSSGDVYQGTNLVEATFKKDPSGMFTDHAEYRVLDHIQPLVDSSDGNIIIFYSYLSPCYAKCASKTHPYNIIEKINTVVSNSKWKDGAFVFSKVFDSYPDGSAVPLKDLQQALVNLGGSQFGLGNIFRCYYPNKQGLTCIRCYSNNKFSAECLKN